MNASFAHGHAVVVGVGADLTNTVDDATGLAGILPRPGALRLSEQPGAASHRTKR